MNEINNIHLGRQAFTISASAHKILKKYLRDITNEMGGESEVMVEVERRMAELLLERGLSGETVIIESDVKYLQEQLGEPKDIGKASLEVTATINQSSHPAKRLFRDPEGGVIAGVASGLANYFGLDPILVRAIFLLLIFASGFGFFAYLVLWLIVPPVRTKSDRLQMMGQPITVDTIKEVVQKARGVSSARVSHTARRILRSGVRLARIFIGILLIFCSSIVAITLFIGGIYLLVAPERFFGEVVLFPTNIRDYLTLGIGVLLGLITSFLAGIVGLAFIRGRAVIQPKTIGILSVIIVMLSVVFVILAIETGYQVNDRYTSQRVSNVQEFDNFHELVVKGDGQIRYVPSDRFAIETHYLRDQQKQLPEITTTSQKATIEFQPKITGCLFGCNDTREVVIYAPQLSSIRIDGDTDFRTNDPLRQSDLFIEVNNEAQVLLESIDVTEMTFNEKTLKLQNVQPASTDHYIVFGEHLLNASTEVSTLQLTGSCEDTTQNQITFHKLLPDTIIINKQEFSAEEALSGTCIVKED